MKKSHVEYMVILETDGPWYKYSYTQSFPTLKEAKSCAKKAAKTSGVQPQIAKQTLELL